MTPNSADMLSVFMDSISAPFLKLAFVIIIFDINYKHILHKRSLYLQSFYVMIKIVKDTKNKRKGKIL